jgi:hypothetical protein
LSKLADALVFAVNYIGSRDDEADDKYLHEDVKALEYVAHTLRDATPAEQLEVAAAAKRALAAELAAGASPNSRWVNELRTFMEDMLGEAWMGNDLRRA